MSNTSDLQKCVVCGRPATGGYVDLDEIEPVRGADGQMYQSWKSRELVPCCADHYRQPRLHMRDGTIQDWEPYPRVVSRPPWGWVILFLAASSVLLILMGFLGVRAFG